MIDYLNTQLTTIESTFPGCGIIIQGDFNRRNIKQVLNHFKLKQLVKFSTRHDALLDLVITNLSKFYQDPIKLSNFGLSDHCTIVVKSKERTSSYTTKTIVKIRDLRPFRRASLSLFLKEIDWSLIQNLPTCDEKLAWFENTIHTGMDILLPIKSIKKCSDEPPWLSHQLKSLITQRQKALAAGDQQQFNLLRNKVNRERKKCRSRFYDTKVKQLKTSDPKRWWKAVKSLCGMETITKPNEIKNFQARSGQSSLKELANVINSTFLSPTKDFQPLISEKRTFVQPEDVSSSQFLTAPKDILKILNRSKPFKAPGPDNIPSWLLKENANILARPVSDIINASISEQKLPSIWKSANVIPLPKQKPITDVNKHLRPISLTPIISKVAEDYVVNKFIKPAILEIVDSRQFGIVPKSSTTYALINMIHDLAKGTDGTGAMARLVLFDFRKAFDLIDHHILVSKMKHLNIPKPIINWVTDFLTNRKQRVKLDKDCYSEWSYVPAGVPQGTKLGPWLYALMINDLNATDVDLWKFVDDTTIAEIVNKGKTSYIQNAVQEIENQSSELNFLLNDDKCKELRIDFSKTTREVSCVQVYGKPLEVITNAKVLGLNISSNLKWNNHVEKTIKKASTRLYFLCQLKRAKVPEKDMLQFYSTCIRPILEYASQVFHYALPKYLSNDIERIQKRALSLIFPNVPYTSALANSGLITLQERREIICRKTFSEIKNNRNHKLHHLLPDLNTCNYRLRNNRTFKTPRCKTTRFQNSFIMASVNEFNHTNA